MSSETLSQDEIDLLFSGGPKPKEADLPRRDSDQELQVYDFRRPNRISKDRLRSLEAMYSLLS